jgi:hydrogenase expression/formation protein HypE
MRDPTRGGLVTVMHDIARATGSTLWLDEMSIPVRDQVRGACDMLGYDPLYLACEGRVVAVLWAAG